MIILEAEVLQREEAIEVEIITHTEVLEAEIGSEIVRCGNYASYKGPYSVDPSFDGHKLETKDLVMTEDLTVKPIPLVKISNPSGGKTIIIGG